VPAATPSGRSVVSRMTRTGLPSAGASSCTPPLSVSTISAIVEQAGEVRDSRAGRSWRRWRGRRARRPSPRRTLGLGWTGKMMRDVVARDAMRLYRAGDRLPCPPPKFSRRCDGDGDDALAREAGGEIGQPGRRGRGRRAMRFCVSECSASITVLPVTWIARRVDGSRRAGPPPRSRWARSAGSAMAGDNACGSPPRATGWWMSPDCAGPPRHGRPESCGNRRRGWPGHRGRRVALHDHARSAARRPAPAPMPVTSRAAVSASSALVRAASRRGRWSGTMSAISSTWSKQAADAGR
jgi:hypothetical protein